MRYLLLAICSLAICSACFGDSCEDVAKLELPHGKITRAVLEPAGPLPGFGPIPGPQVAASCRVSATLSPAPDSKIRIEVWMPSSGWNGRYQGVGNGGYAGAIPIQEMAQPLNKGFAVASTDMGTFVEGREKTNPFKADGLIGHPDKWDDWGWRSTHEMTLAAKKIIHAYYGRDPQYSYFAGCSTGGQQSLVEAQRFPDDYDGILYGAPANFRTHLHMWFIWANKEPQLHPEARIPKAKIELIYHSVSAACAAQKAVPSDDFLTDPLACHWDPRTIECKNGDRPDCLTPTQVAMAVRLYSGPVNPTTQARIQPGAVRGSERGWDSLLVPPGFPIFESLFKWVFGPNWDWHTFDFDRDVTATDAKLAKILNATNPDLSEFKARRHKILGYHGWDDLLVPPEGDLDYLRSVENAQASTAKRNRVTPTAETQTFYRLFMVPGMGHCSDGPGLNTVDAIDSLQAWVEKGVAPEQVLAKRIEKGTTVMTRPICPYPKFAKYVGKGDPSAAASFVCAGR